MPLPDRLQQGLGFAAEHGEQDEVLFARSKALGSLAHVLCARRVVVESAATAGHERNGARDRPLDRRRGRAVPTFHQQAELVQHRAVAAGRENVEQRLRREDLSDRSGEWRPPRFGSDATDLGQRVEEAIAGSVRAEVNVERGDEPGRQVVLGGPNGDPRCDGSDGLVPDVLVDQVSRLPQGRRVDTGVAAESMERIDKRLVNASG